MARVFGGTAHGAFDFFVVDALHLAGKIGVYSGIGDLEMSYDQRCEILAIVEQNQLQQKAMLDAEIMRAMGIAPNDPLYDYFRSGTHTVLTVTSVAAAGYGVVKGGVSLARAARVPANVEKAAVPIWTATKEKAAVENAFHHWKKHGADFPELLNSKQYVEATKKFTESPPIGTLTKIRSNGDNIFYHPSTNTFAITSQEGIPRTMYKPDPLFHKRPSNLDYYHGR
jgi:hypothetical protein